MSSLNKPTAAAPPPLPSGSVAKPPPRGGVPPTSAANQCEQHSESLPKPPPPPKKGMEDDDDFLRSIVDEVATRNQHSTATADGLSGGQGLVLARDADGFERLMDPSLVSKDAIVVRTGAQVKCPGCGEWFPEEKTICPGCFRENWQGAGGQKRKKKRALQVVSGCLGVGLIVGLFFLYRPLVSQIVLPLELKIFLWVASPAVLSGIMVWLRRQVMA